MVEMLMLSMAVIAADHYGDPLPRGAVARLGTMRFRHEGEAQSLVFSPNGKILAAQTAGGVVLWDAHTGKELRRLPLVGGGLSIGGLIQFSPDGKVLAGPRDSNHIGLWDVDTGKLLRAIGLPKKVDDPYRFLYTLRFSPNGKLLAVSGDDERCSVLDVATGAALHHFKDKDDIGGVMLGGLTFSPDGKTLALAQSALNHVQIRDARTGKLLRHWQGHSELMCDLVFSPDGKMLAAGGTDRITIWDGDTGKVRTRIKKKMGQIKNLAFTPDGKTLVSGSESDGKVHVWDVATGAERRQLDAHGWVLRSMALSPDGKTVAAGTVYNTIRLWDLASGRELFPDQPGHDASVNAVAYSPDGKRLVSAGENRQVWLWDTATGKAVRQIAAANSVRAVAFSPDGQRVALLSPGRYFTGKDIYICEVASGKDLFRLPPGDARAVNALAFSPDGKTLVSADWQSKGKNEVIGNLNVWDASTGRFLRRFSMPGIDPECLTFRGDGQILAIGGGWVPDSIRLWDMERGEEILALRGHEHNVTSIAFSPDGRTLVSGSIDRTVRLWEVATGKEIAVLKGHKQAVATVAFSPAGRIVATGADVNLHNVYRGRPDSIRLWDAANGEEIQHFQGHDSNVSSLVFAPDGAHLASGLRNSTVLLWEVPRKGRTPRRLRSQDLKSLWSDLAGENAAKAYAAIRELTDDPEQAVPFLADHVRAMVPLSVERIRQRIADLDSDEYTVRQAARKELAEFGEQATPLLRQRLAAKPPLEVRKRLEELLSETKLLHAGEVLRGLRSAIILEQIGTPGACRLLEQLARGAPEARLTREAKSSLERLAQRAAK